MYQRIKAIEHGSISNESPSPTFGINLLKSFVLLPLFDNAEGRKQEAQNYSHIPINSGEDIVQRHVCKVGDWCNTKVRGYIG